MCAVGDGVRVRGPETPAGEITERLPRRVGSERHGSPADLVDDDDRDVDMSYGVMSSTWGKYVRYRVASRVSSR